MVMVVVVAAVVAVVVVVGAGAGVEVAAAAAAAVGVVVVLVLLLEEEDDDDDDDVNSYCQYILTCSTTERITPPSASLQNTPKSLNFNLKYLNHYLIIFSKNLNISSYIPILVNIIILERAA
jgi:hypothetical protein